MKIGEITNQLGIPRARIYYLEQKGYINPTRTERGEIDTLDFSENDFLLIKHIWKYLQDGFKLKIAFKKAKEKINK